MSCAFPVPDSCNMDSIGSRACRTMYRRGQLATFIFILVTAMILFSYVNQAITIRTLRESVTTLTERKHFLEHLVNLPLETTATINNLRHTYNLPFAKWMILDIVNPIPYNFPLSPNKTCFNKPIDLLIVVPAARANFEQRQAVRDTWGSYVKDPTKNAVLLFFLGSSPGDEKPDVQKDIQAEFSRFGDIVQSDFMDTYLNLTVKSLTVFKWIDKFCPNAKLIIKVDDDEYVVLPKFFNKLKALDTELGGQPFITGSVQRKVEPNQNKKSKWYTPREMFNGEYYPDFASGPCYSMNGKTARLLYQVAQRTHLFWLEDVYIGICAKVVDVAMINDDAQSTYKPRAHHCPFRRFHVFGHKYNITELHTIHKDLNNPNRKCPKTITLSIVWQANKLRMSKGKRFTEISAQA